MNEASERAGPRVPVARPVAVGRRRKPPVPRLPWWGRALLVVMVVGLVAVFAAAASIHPYDADGNPARMATHTQLGMPPCNMVVATGKPCPACGMTTSFALLVHADPSASLRANWVGTLLAITWAALIPWGVVSAARGRMFGIHRGEFWLTVAVSALLALMIGRWLFVFFG